MIESLIIMDRYLLNDILEERDYMEWRRLIGELNNEYGNIIPVHRIYFNIKGSYWVFQGNYLPKNY